MGFEFPRKLAVALLAAGGLMLASETRAQTPSTQASSEAQTDTEEGGLFRGLSFTLGPVRWRATLVTEFRLQMPPDQPATRDFVELGNLSAASYIFQPWFLQVSANLGFITSKADTESTQSRSSSLTGGGSLSLFPASRFPFSATFSVNDSRASGEIVGVDYRSTQLGLRQSYRALDDTQYSVSFERSELNGTNFGIDALDVLGATVSGRRGAQSFDVDGRASRNTTGANGTQIDFARLSGRHSYVPASNLSVETLASYDRLDLAQKTASLRNALSNNRFVQLVTLASWRPEEDEPLYDEKHPMLLAGGLRVTGSSSEQNGGSAENLGVSGSLGLTYTINPLTRLTAGASLTQANATAGAGGLSSTQSATITYSPLPIPLREYLYTWNLSGGGSNAIGGAESQQSLFTLASHQVARNLALAGNSQLAINIGQSLGANLGTGGTRPASGVNGLILGHNAQASWSLTGDKTTQTYVSVSASDARRFGDAPSDFQLLNLQATRQAPLNALSFWTANLTVQGARQHDDSTAVTAASRSGFNVTTSGSVTYEHRRAFGVPRLRAFASYVANQAQLQSRAQGDIDAPRQSVTDALEARLEYQIGKSDVRLTFRSAAVEGKRNTMLFVRLTRQF